jgi:hypothetical protein
MIPGRCQPKFQKARALFPLGGRGAGTEWQATEPTDSIVDLTPPRQSSDPSHNAKTMRLRCNLKKSAQRKSSRIPRHAPEMPSSSSGRERAWDGSEARRQEQEQEQRARQGRGGFGGMRNGARNPRPPEARARAHRPTASNPAECGGGSGHREGSSGTGRDRTDRRGR